MEQLPPTVLTPEQAADVIKYFHDNENAEARKNGWKDKVCLGRSAIHAATKRGLLPDKPQLPLLTYKEISAGVDYIEKNDLQAKWLNKKSSKTKNVERERDDAYDKRVDKLGWSYHDSDI